MDTITIDKTIVNHLTQNKDYYLYCKISWKIPNYSMVKKGDMLAILSYNSIEERYVLFAKRKNVTEKEIELFSPNDGYLFIIDIDEYGWYNNNEITYSNQKKEDIAKIDNNIGYIFNNISDLFSYYYSCSRAVLKKDPCTTLNKIDWNNNSNLDILDLDFEGFSISFAIDFIDNNCVFCIDYYDKLCKGDCFSLLFNNAGIIDFSISDISVKHEPYLFTLYQEDIDLLMTSSLVSLRIFYHNNAKRPQTITLNEDCFGHPYKDNAIHAYIKSRIDAIHKLIPDYQFPRRSVLKTQEKYEFNWCYVYLMRDDTNGYHKIGISNTPEYRERTLQSEKPTIEMLACKKFPTRKIAEALESALHTAYSQQRLRGEWFNLNDADVAAIIETLK